MTTDLTAPAKNTSAPNRKVVLVSREGDGPEYGGRHLNRGEEVTVYIYSNESSLAARRRPGPMTAH